MAWLGQSSAPEAKLVNKMSTTVQLKLKSFILQTLTLNVQFWSAHRVHGTKLHPKRGCRELKSMEVKKLATSKVGMLNIYLLLPLFQFDHNRQFEQQLDEIYFSKDVLVVSILDSFYAECLYLYAIKLYWHELMQNHKLAAFFYLWCENL